MPFITVAEVKSIAKLSTSESDLLVKTLIPIALQHFHSFTRNYFLDTRVQFVGSPLQFDRANKKIIKLNSGTTFSDFGFRQGYYKISWSYANDGVVEITAVTDYELVCENDLQDETTQSSVIITKVNYPEMLKYDLAMYIASLLYQQAGNIKSESLPGGYSYTLDDKPILEKLFTKYKIPY